MHKVYPVGKLPAEDLERLLSRYIHTADPRVLVGPGIGRDAAVISFGPSVLVLKTDPITFATDRIGWYAVHINANDIASMGATPRWFLSTVLLPEAATTPALIDDIFSGLSDACQELGIALCGGHTEITHGLDRPILIGQMIGEAPEGQFVTAAGARIGDDILLTKGIPIEAAAVIAREKGEMLRTHFSGDFLDRCRNYLHTPGLSVVPEAKIAVETGGVHAMHDPTEGGLASGLREIGMAAGVGLLIDVDRVPVLPEARALCDFFHLDPLGTIASGALLLTVDPASTERIVRRLEDAHIEVSVIGVIKPAGFGFKMQRQGTLSELPTFNRDEIGKLFETA